MARDCYLVSIKGKETMIYNVELRQDEDLNSDGQKIHKVVEAEGRIESRTQLEPINEIERITIGEGYALNIASEMPGIPRAIAEYKLHIRPEMKPVRQKKRHVESERQKVVRLEVQKLLKADFIHDAKGPEWISNTILVKKSNGDWRMCIDFTNLNKACPMDLFPLPKIDQLVDSTSGHAFLSFMDAFSGYNQIKMSPEDEDKTTFVTDLGLYCHRVMPFGLHNASATYQ